MRLLHSTPVLVALVLAGLCSQPSRASESTPAPRREARPALDRILLKEILRASGVSEPDRLARYERAVDLLAVEMSRKLGAAQNPYRSAKKLHVALHESLLRRYDASADGLDKVLDRGEFNCLSASLLYGLMGRAFGLDVQVAEIPRHVYVNVWVDRRKIVVEATSRKGFDLRPGLGAATSLPTGPGYGANAGSAPPPVDFGAEAVDLETAVGFLWHNAGRRALERGETLSAARNFLEESKLRPPGDGRSETLAALLARAFRMEYEVGNFAAAFRIAEIGVSIFPGQTTARDRLLAAALKRIESATEQDRVAQAEEMLAEAAGVTRDPVDTRRLERGACPIIMAASVRLGDWERAARMVRRIEEAEPDRAESRRLGNWVARRRLEALSGDEQNACTEHPVILPGENGEGFVGGPAVQKLPRSAAD